MSEFPSITKHHALVRALPCRVTGRTTGNTIHHVHGGTMRENLVARGMDGTKGAGMRGYGDVLVIPLQIEFHSIGQNAVDGGMGRLTWEALYGEQARHIDAVGFELGYDLWEMHRALVSRKSKVRFGNT